MAIVAQLWDASELSSLPRLTDASTLYNDFDSMLQHIALSHHQKTAE